MMENIERIGKLIELIPELRSRKKYVFSQVQNLDAKVGSFIDSVRAGYGQCILDYAALGNMSDSQIQWCENTYLEIHQEIKNFGARVAELNLIAKELKTLEDELKQFGLVLIG
jgi:exopolysaccharide biosynthesis predicted pyruvyltransferase EpsI